jgi:hypothetical protein
MRELAVVVSLVVLAGCSTLKTDDLEIDGLAPSCIEQPFRAALHVDAKDPRGVWATNFDTGEVVAVRPRPPSEFTFDPARPTMLFDGSGELLTLNGEISRTGCFDPIRRVVYFGSSDLPDPARPAN